MLVDREVHILFWGVGRYVFYAVGQGLGGWRHVFYFGAQRGMHFMLLDRGCWIGRYVFYAGE